MVKNCRHHESGAALIVTLMMSSILLLLTSIGGMMVLGAQKDTSAQLRSQAQASNIARAGVQDALGWFKIRGQSSPVANPLPTSGDCIHSAFNPIYDSDPLARETDNESIGIVRDIEIDRAQSIYGRYIVRKQPCSASADEQRATRNTVQDVTNLRGKGQNGTGIVWRIASEGIIYRRLDKTANADGVFSTGPSDPPNVTLGESKVAVEINRLNIQTPLAPITLMSPSGGATSNFNTGNCKVTAKGATYGSIFHGSRGSTPIGGTFNPDTVGGAPLVQTHHRHTTTPIAQPISAVDFFAVSESELRGLSDSRFTSVDGMPFNQTRNVIPLPMSIVFLEGDFTFNATKPLLGTGVLYVKGNLTFADNASNSYSGLIFVTGHLSVGRDNSLAGAVVANSVSCTQQAFIEYNPTILNTVRNALGLYRENTLSYISN